MAYYRLYFLRYSRINGVKEIEAPDDATAFEAAKADTGDDALELWQEGRKVATIEPNDLGSQLVANRRAQREAQASTLEDQSQTG